MPAALDLNTLSQPLREVFQSLVGERDEARVQREELRVQREALRQQQADLRQEAEVLDLQPVELFVRVIKREQLACPRPPEAVVAMGPTPERILPGGKLTDAFLTDVTLKKYLAHLPADETPVGVPSPAAPKGQHHRAWP